MIELEPLDKLRWSPTVRHVYECKDGSLHVHLTKSMNLEELLRITEFLKLLGFKPIMLSSDEEGLVIVALRLS
ncbi:MAG: hypothetical protein DRO09_02135 [Thermoprotei archaeon]|nr:MAG: hypothetical protein DRO09_02135 [Thermoprotei archaeon]